MIIGRPIAQLGSGVAPRVDSPAMTPIVNTTSPCFAPASLFHFSSNAANGAWPSANKPVALPFRLPTATTVYQLGWDNGSSAGDNADIGIYDESWNLLVSSGSTTAVGASALQYVNVTDTVLQADTLYYLVHVRDVTTANRVVHWTGSIGALNLCGVMDSTTNAFPLPNPLTNMVRAATFVNLPYLQMAFRASPI